MSSAEDRFAIIEVLSRYAFAVDDRDFEAARALFTDDAWLDYTSSGCPAAGPRDEVIDWIAEGLGSLGPSQHVLANHIVEVEGDAATSRCLMFNPLLSPEDPPANLLLLGGEYRDTWRRGPDGWQIANRVHLVRWMRSLPG